MLENIDNARYQTENFTILKYCFENYNDNYYITKYVKKVPLLQGETDALQVPMEEEIDETKIPLGEKEEESEEQKEELPSN